MLKRLCRRTYFQVSPVPLVRSSDISKSMTLFKFTISIIVVMTLIATTLLGQKPAGDPDLARKIARFAPTTLTAETSKLTPKDRQGPRKDIFCAQTFLPC